MRFYVGFGNAGCKMARNILTHMSAAANSPGGFGPPVQFVFGDADANNNVITGIRSGSSKTPTGLATSVFDLDLFWSGGCGVYHIIGELITQRALNQNLDAVFGTSASNPIYALLAAGGGTGGGASAAFIAHLQAVTKTPQRPIRLFVALPEMDRPPSPGKQQVSLEIHGPDDFQAAAAGRYLIQYMAGAFTSIPAPHPPNRQLFLLSNSWLATLASTASYPLAVAQLNRFLCNVILLMDDGAHKYPILDKGQNQLVTFGLGLASLPAEDASPEISALAAALIRKALGPLNLEADAASSPTGLSALPMPARLYCDVLAEGQPTQPGALSQLLEGAEKLSQSAEALRAVFHCCRTVHVQLVYRNQAIAARMKAAELSRYVTQILQPLFGTHRDVVVTSITPDASAGWFTAHPETLFPTLEKGKSADVAALVFLGNLIVEDVFRLMVYYIQSSFPWHAKDVDTVAEYLRKLLLENPVRTRILKPIPQADSERKPVVEWNTNTWNAIADQFKTKLTDDDAPAYVPAGQREVYPEQFWGNFEHLRRKVLQNLRMVDGTAFDAAKLTVDHVARALAFLSYQISEV